MGDCFVTLSRAGNGILNIDQEIPSDLSKQDTCLFIDPGNAKYIKVQNIKIKLENDTFYMEGETTDGVSTQYKTATIVLSVLVILLLGLVIFKFIT